jgi:hypothetical protein
VSLIRILEKNTIAQRPFSFPGDNFAAPLTVAFAKGRPPNPAELTSIRFEADERKKRNK